MIKIYDAQIVCIEWKDLYQEDGISEDYIENVLKRRKHADKFQYLIKKDGKIVGAASLSDIRENKIFFKTFYLSENLFIAIRDYVHTNQVPEGVCFPVLNDNGHFMFLVIYIENIVLGIKKNDFSDYEKRFLDAQELDFTLINQYHIFVFTETEEYSVALARMLQTAYPDKKCIFLDKRTRLLIRDKTIRCLPVKGISGKCMNMLGNWMSGKNQNLSFANRFVCLCLYKIIKLLEIKGDICIISADKNHLWPINIIYTSTKVMYSLLWCRKRESYGPKNKGESIFHLDYACYNEGLVSIIRWTYAHIMWILERGYTPVVDLHSYPNQYLNSENENMWEYFFEPVSEISSEDVYESHDVISALNNDIILGESQINPYQEKWKDLPMNVEEFQKIIRMNSETRKYIEERIPKEICNNTRVLGVVMRGTDFREEAAAKINKEWRKNIVKADTFLQACCYYKDKLKCEYVFLATEDSEYFEMFQKCFGDKLLFINQKRVTYDYRNKEYVQVVDLLDIKDGKTSGRNYLAIIKSLSECSSLIFNIECGAVQLAHCWNSERYELFKHIAPDWEC